jgi:hypothetical protein
MRGNTFFSEVGGGVPKVLYQEPAKQASKAAV